MHLPPCSGRRADGVASASSTRAAVAVGCDQRRWAYRRMLSMPQTQHDVVRREFGQQAARFGEQGLTLSNQAYLQWMVEHLGLQRHFEVLDVAAGTGHLSRTLAPHVKR